MDCTLASTGLDALLPITLAGGLLALGAASVVLARRKLRRRVGALALLLVGGLLVGGLTVAAPIPAQAACVTAPVTGSPVPDFTPSIGASVTALPANQSDAGAGAATVLSIPVQELLGHVATGPLAITVTWPEWLNGQAPVVGGTGWTLVSAAASTAELTYTPTIGASAASSTLTLGLSVSPAAVGPLSGTAIVTIHTASAGDTVVSNNVAAVPLTLYGLPDLTPVIVMPSNIFDPGETKTFVAYLEEIQGYDTDAGTVTLTVSAPDGYILLPYDPTLTSATPTGDAPQDVQNSSFSIVGTPTPQSVVLKANASVLVNAFDVVFLGLQIQRTTAADLTTGVITVTLQDDTTGGYDTNPSNNLYTRIITTRATP